MREPETLSKAPFVAAAFLLSLKLLLLVAIGPIFQPDTTSYVNFADVMLASRHWLNDADLAAQAVPATTYRSIGYPALIAAAKVLTAGNWPYAIVGLQIAASLTAFFAIFKLGANLGLTRKWALAAALAYATSVQFALDQCVLTDSLNASAIILAVTIFLQGSEFSAKLRPLQIVTSGLLVAAAFLLREVMVFLVVVFIPLFMLRCMLVQGAPRIVRFLPCVLVLLPIMAANAGYQFWNLHRTGQRFVTTSPQMAALLPLIFAAKYSPGVFSGDSPLDHYVRPLLKQYSMSEDIEINDALFKSGYRAPEIARMAMDKYVATWRQHPGAMLNLIRIAISENILKLMIRPVASVCELFDWAGRSFCHDYRSLYRKLFRHPSEVTAIEISVFIIITIQNASSIILSAVFFLGIPAFLILAWRNRDIGSDRALLLAAGFWILSVGWHLAFAVSLYADRYTAPVIPFMIVGGLIVGAQLSDLSYSAHNHQMHRDATKK